MSGFETILAIAAIGSSIIGTGVSVMGAQQQAAAQRQQADYAAAVAQNNKTLAERAANDALQRGQIEEANQRRKTEALKGRQRAVLAANGVALDTGTPLDVLSDSAGFGELDALTVRANAEREALGFRTQGMNFQNEANLNMLKSSNADAGLASASAIIGGVGTVAKQWYSFTKDQPKTAKAS